MSRALLAFAGASVVTGKLVPTPQGFRDEACVVEIPDGATFRETADGLTITHANGTLQSREIHPDCHSDAVALKMAARRAGDVPNEWKDNAGFTHNEGYKSFSGNNNVPSDPKNGNGQILYYFIGMENTGGGPVNILQPVLGWMGGEWTLASWACCPANISTTSRTITGIKAGDEIVGNMERVDDSTWKIDSTVNGQTTTLQPHIGDYKYIWADVTLEIYSISSCDQYSSGKTHFTDMVLTSASGKVLTPQWTQPSGTDCQGKLDILSASAIDIYHNGGGGPTPTPSPSPSPTPSPTPSGQCHAISSVVTDDWCKANCASGFCPSDLCSCDSVMV